MLVLLPKFVLTSECGAMRQNVIELKDYPRLYTGETIHFDDFPIKNYSVPVRDPQEQLLVQPGQKARKGRGTVSFSLRLPPVTER